MDAGFIYLHGFASSPDSKKAAVFRREFAKRNLPLIVPDLEGGDFENLTLSRQIDIALDLIDTSSNRRIGLIGSSMGGYLAAILAELRKEIAAIYLMAPGFNFIGRWRERLQNEFAGETAVPPFIKVFHYRRGKEVRLNAFIFEDARKWDKIALSRELPTRIVHGLRDEAVDIGESRKFARAAPWRVLVELDSDHGLLDRVDWIAEDCLRFFQDENLLRL